MSKAQAHAEETAEKQMDLLVSAIASCREKPQPLGIYCPASEQNPWLGAEEREIDKKTVAGLRILGLKDPCPYCGNQELWQKIGTYPGLRSQPPESYPTVYDTLERADLEAMLQLQDMLEENEAVRRDAARLAEARETRERLRAEKEAAQAAQEDTFIQRQIDALEAQRAQMEGELKAAGMFAFKAKKEINARLDETRAKAEELRKQEKKRQTELAETVRKDSFALERSDLLFAESPVKIEQSWTATAAAFRLYAEQQG